MSVRSRFGIARLVLAPLAALAGIAFAMVSYAADDCGNGPLRNLGFEQNFSCWASGGVDEAAVVGSEGPAQFPIYADAGITVTPYREAKMVRLGRPKRLAESQPSGVTSVSQTFVADATQIRFAMRIFSFEHRGDDRIVLSLDPVAPLLPASFPVSGATVPMPGGGSASCTQTPCALTIDVGKRGDFLDSGWREISISGLSVGTTYRLGYKLDSIANSGHPTWVYFDGETNKPPVARFDFNPKKPGTNGGPFEGDVFVFSADGSSDPDGDALTYTWSAPALGGETASGPIYMVQFADQTPGAKVCLEVSDGRLKDTVCTGERGIAPLVVVDAPPLVGATNVEGVVGGTVQLRCRYLDPGINDAAALRASVQLGGAPPDALVDEILPALATGFATRTIPTPATSGSQSCVVGGVGAAFQVVPVNPQSRPDEPNTIAGATPLETGWTRQSRLETSADIDVYVLRKGGARLSVGTEVSLELKSGFDYDLVVLAESPLAAGSNPFANASFENAPFQHFPFQHFPFQHFPFQHFPFQHFPFQHFPFQHFPFQHFPFQHFPLETSRYSSLAFEQVPLSQFAGTPDGSTISSSDIGLGELGTLILGASEGQPLVLKGFAANPGSELDKLLFKVAPGETAHYVLVVAHNKAAPGGYALTAESSVEQPLVEALGTQSCQAPPLVSPTTALREVWRPASGAPLTLCVGQEERRRAIYGSYPTAGGPDSFVAAMTPLFDHPDVKCLYVSLPSGLYDAADQNTCDAGVQDSAAQQLSGQVQTLLRANPSIKNVILMGSYNVVPPCAPPDLAEVGNEGLFTSDLLQQSGARLTTLFADGRNITDACYADLTPQQNNGHPLYREDVPIGRLVETPAEMVQKAQAWVQQQNAGGLAVNDALTTGYDFFADVATEIDKEIANKGIPKTVLISPPSSALPWAADQLRCEWLGESNNSCPAPKKPSLASLEAHMISYGLLGAQEFSSPSVPFDERDLVKSSEATGKVTGAVFSLGCHSALSVPNEDAIPSRYLPFPVDHDWAEAAPLWVGPMTFGIGHTDTYTLGHEGLMLLLMKKLLAGLGSGISVGEALVAAKAEFTAQQFPSIDAYAEKALISTAILGIPQTKLRQGTQTQQALQALSAPPAASAAPIGTLSVTMQPSATSASAAISLATTPQGKTAHQLDGRSCAIYGRPLLGCVTTALLRAPTPGLPVRSVLLRGGAYTDQTGVAIANADVSTEWTDPSSRRMPNSCVPTFVPGQLASVNRLEDGRETVVVTGAQFECTLPESQRGIVDPVGTLRTFTALRLEEFQPTLAAYALDRQPSEVLRLDLTGDFVTKTVTAKLCATDASGMREVTVLRFLNGAIDEFALKNPGPCSVNSPWEIQVPNAVDAFLRVNFVGNDGLLRVKGNKARLLQVKPVEIRSDFVNTGGGSTSLNVFIGGFAGVSHDAVLAVEWGDGSPTQYVPLFDANGNLSSLVVIDANGDATLRVDHVFAGSGPYNVSVELIASNATGFDQATLAACGDVARDTNLASADWVSCSLNHTGAKLDFVLGTLGSIDDNNVQYRVRFPASGAMVKFNKGKCTAFTGAACKVTKTGSQVRFQFNAAAIWGGTTPLGVFFETQSGVPGSPSEGKPDLMPDSGTYTILP